MLNSTINGIGNGINNFLAHIAISNTTSWINSLHITGIGMILGALILLFAGKKIMSGVLNIVIIILLVVGLASILGFNIWTLL